MNFEQAKALRLKQWRSTLNDKDFRMQNPEAYRSSLHVASAQLAAEGLVDKLEQFELDEMANSAYWLAIEELQASAVLYHSASHSDLVARDGSPNLGTVCQSTFSQNGDAHPSRAYNGKVYRHGEALKLVFSYAPTTGIIEGLLLTLDDGRQFDLVETGRMINGVIYKPIEDPDTYRWLVDSAQVAQESKNLVLMEKIDHSLNWQGSLDARRAWIALAKRKTARSVTVGALSLSRYPAAAFKTPGVIRCQ